VTSHQDQQSSALQPAAALASGSPETVGGFLASDVQAWLASPQQSLSSDIESVSGAEDAAAALSRLAPSNLTIIATVRSSRICWAEIDRRADGEEETCTVGLTYNDDGEVSRLVWLRVPLVPASQVDAEPSSPDARPVIECYFADLMRSQFREAAGRFSLDTIYSHPPYRGGTERVLFLGRDALWRGLVTERGPSPARQVITGFWQRHHRFFVEGVVEGIPNAGTFISTGEITPAGEIARYVAFYSSRRIAPDG
jgi:hypothetical protein